MANCLAVAKKIWGWGGKRKFWFDVSDTVGSSFSLELSLCWICLIHEEMMEKQISLGVEIAFLSLVIDW